MIIQQLWGNIWVAHYSDNVWADIIIRLIIGFFIALFAIAFVLTIYGAYSLYKSYKQGGLQHEEAVSLPAAEDRLIGKGDPASCPHCGNTRSIDVRPCIRCGRSF